MMGTTAVAFFFWPDKALQIHKPAASKRFLGNIDTKISEICVSALLPHILFIIQTVLLPKKRSLAPESVFVPVYQTVVVFMAAMYICEGVTVL
jgi:hypothetical protein